MSSSLLFGLIEGRSIPATYLKPTSTLKKKSLLLFVMILCVAIYMLESPAKLNLYIFKEAKKEFGVLYAISDVELKTSLLAIYRTFMKLNLCQWI